MGWARRWRIDSQAKLKRVLNGIAAVVVDPHRPFEIVLREEYKDKTDAQRRLFHAIVADGARGVGLTPAEAKQAIKRDYYGWEVRTVHGRRYELVQSSEDSDRAEYSGMIDYALMWFAEAGVVVQDRRPR